MSSGSEVVAAARIAPDSACTRPRNVSADRFIRPGLRSGSVRVCAQSRQYDSARSRSSGSDVGFSPRSSVPQRSSRMMGPLAGLMVAVAVWSSAPIIQVTPGARSTIGSLVPSTRRPSASATSCTGAWPNSGRGAKVTTASASPVTTRMRSVRPGTSSWAR
ncbi:Uncharacterised protein [Mycobacteroides abscessus]|nr:Uncharacterised protein [Mycobacteroides abscessus]